MRGIALGGTGGVAAGFFGVGMAPYLQLGFLTSLRLSLVQTIGTTMLTLVFISGSAATVLARHGDVSGKHLIAAIVGLVDWFLSWSEIHRAGSVSSACVERWSRFRSWQERWSCFCEPESSLLRTCFDRYNRT